MHYLDMTKNNQQADYFCKLLLVLFWVYCVLPSISQKVYSCVFQHCTSPKNLVYVVEEPDTLPLINNAVAEYYNFDFLTLTSTGSQSVITLAYHFKKPKAISRYATYGAYSLYPLSTFFYNLLISSS
jgi:hypothetical protein